MTANNQSAISNGAFWRTIRVELRRAIFSIRFLLGIVMTLAWMILNAAESVRTYDRAVFAGVVQLIRLGLDGLQSTGPVLLAISTIPYTFSYLAEKECGFNKQIIERVGMPTYGICKVVACGTSAFLMGAVALALFIAALSAAGILHTVRYDEVKETYAAIAVTVGSGWYYGMKICHVGLVCSQAAVFSLMVLSFIPNSYVGFLAPLIGYYMADCILALLTRIVSGPLWSLVSPMQLFWGQPLPDIVPSFLWTVFVLVMLMFFFGICFFIRLRKEHI